MLDQQIRDDLLYLAGDVAWINVTFQNAWVNFGGTWQTVQYRRIGDLVYLRGVAKSGTVGAGTPVFTLPVGYRPIVQQTRMIVSNSLFGRVNIPVSGGCAVVTGSNLSVFFDGIAFPVVA
jgi:hypothetical protein